MDAKPVKKQEIVMKSGSKNETRLLISLLGKICATLSWTLSICADQNESFNSDEDESRINTAPKI